MQPLSFHGAHVRARDRREAAWPSLTPQRRRRHHKQQQQPPPELDPVAVVKYGLGIAAGVSVVSWLKQQIRRLPLVGAVTSPFLALMPSAVLGAAVGVAVVFNIDRGDASAAQRTLQQEVLPAVQRSAHRARRELTAAAADASGRLRDAHERSLAASEAAAREAARELERLGRAVDAAAADAESALAPVVQRHAARVQRHLDGAAAAAWDQQQPQPPPSPPQQQPQQQQQQRWWGGDGGGRR